MDKSRLEEEALMNEYAEILALPPAESIKALEALWKRLAASCTPEQPCADCRRAMAELGEE